MIYQISKIEALVDMLYLKRIAATARSFACSQQDRGLPVVKSCSAVIYTSGIPVQPSQTSPATLHFFSTSPIRNDRDEKKKEV